MTVSAFFKNKIVRFFIAIIVALIIAFIPPPAGLTAVSMRWVAIFVCLIMLMSLSVFQDYLCALFCLTALLVFRVGDVGVVFSQFASGTLWSIISILGFAAAIQKTTILTRVTVNVLRIFPKSYGGQIAAIMTASLVMALLIPSIYAKIVILTGIALSIAKVGGFERGSKPAAGLFCALLVTGYWLSNTFITGNPNVQVMMAFMGQPMHFWEWLSGTWLWAIIMTAGTYGFIMLYYRPKPSVPVASDYVDRQIAEMPPITMHDKYTAVIVCLALILWATEPWTGITALVTTLMALVAFSGVGVLTPEDFVTRIDWKMVVTIGGIMSIADFIGPMGVTAWLAVNVGPIVAPVVGNVWLFMPALVVMAFLLRFVVVSMLGSLAIFVAIFQGLVIPMGFHPFIVVFVANMTIQTWAASYNNVLVMPVYTITQNKLGTHQHVRWMAYALVAMSIVAYMASIPMWRMVGLLP